MQNFQKINREEYRKRLDKVLFKTFFHEPEWHKFLENEFKWLKFEYYLYKEESLFPMAIVGKKLISLPFCEYGGPLLLRTKVNLDNFIKDILEEFKNIKVKFHPQIKPGDINSEVNTHWIENLNNLNAEDLFNSFRKTTRYSIRDSYLLESHIYKKGKVVTPQDIYAPEEPLNIKRCSNSTELKEFYKLYINNLKNKKTVPYPLSFIKYLYNHADTEVLLYLYGNKVIAGCLFLHYNGFVHYFLSASDYRYRSLGANYKILWTKIKKSVGDNYKVFDLGASPKGSELEIFKKGWRGKEYPILQIGIKRSEDFLRSSKLRNIWGLLPNFVIKKLSPYLIKYRI